MFLLVGAGWQEAKSDIYIYIYIFILLLSSAFVLYLMYIILKISTSSLTEIGRNSVILFF